MSGPVIGIDARKIRDFGIGRHLEGLLGALARDGGPERWVLFVADPKPASLPGELPGLLDPGRFRLEPCTAPLYSVRELFAFRGAAARHGLDLLHFPHYVRSLDPGCPVTVTIHDAIHLSHPPSPAARVYARRVMGWAARSAAALFTVSQAAREDLAARLDVPADRFSIVPNGVSELFRPPAPEAVAAFVRARGLPRDFALCPGSHRPHKNLRAAVEGFALAALPDAELVIPARDADAAKRVADLRRPRVRVAEGVSDEDLPLLYAAARLVVAPSLAEGFGLPALEAAACGAPVLATAIGPHREVLGDAAAWIDARGRPEDIATALRALWGDAGTRAELARRGPERARAFPWSRAAAASLEAWRKVLGTALPGGAGLG